MELTELARIRIRGRKVVLREKCLEDVGADYAWRTDEELARLDATQPLELSYEEFATYAKDELNYITNTSKRLAIETMDGLHIGNCMFYDIDKRRGQAELGIMIGDRDYWGKGFGSDAVDTMLTHIFTTTQLNRIYIHTLNWNKRARCSFAKSGFRERKHVRRSGMEFVLMEVMRLEWGKKIQDRPGQNGNVLSKIRRGIELESTDSRS